MAYYLLFNSTHYIVYSCFAEQASTAPPRYQMTPFDAEIGAGKASRVR